MKSNTFIIPPHGGSLINLMVDDPEEKHKLIQESNDLPRIDLSTLEFSDLIMLGTGAFSPLGGFMAGPDYRSVLENMRLADGTLWPLPVTITVDDADDYKVGNTIALTSPYTGYVAGHLLIEDIFHYDNDAETSVSFGTNKPSHPGVKKLEYLGKYHIVNGKRKDI